jgi:hypothetical protein
MNPLRAASRLSPRLRPVVSLVFLGTTLGAQLACPARSQAQAAGNRAEVTFTRDIAPILQRSCQSCHRPNSVAPMSLLTYEEVRPWASAIKLRTAIRDRMGTMPPWFIEKDVGIQDYKNDLSLTDEEITTIASWVDAGAPEGDPAHLPPPLVFAAENEWTIGTPDLIVDLPAYTMEAHTPDWWGMIPPAPTGLTDDRYVAAMEVKEISDVEGGVGGQSIFHHAILASLGPDGRSSGAWPIHEVGRNAQIFDPKAGRLLLAGSQFLIPGAHLNSNHVATTAHLRLGFKFHPSGYEPEYQTVNLIFGNGEIDLRPMQPGQEVEIFTMLEENMKITTFEPHMHAAGVRMCLEAIWEGRSETLTCAGYDHNWVKVYDYADHAAPLLPKGTLVRVTAYFDTTENNRNVVDPRNWGGLGHRSIDNMAIVFLPGVRLSDEEFEAEMAERREALGLEPGETAIGCPLCGLDALPAALRSDR